MVKHSTWIGSPDAAPRPGPADDAPPSLFDASGVSVVTDPRVAMEYDVLLKIVVVGDSAVGKSALLRR